MRINKPLTLKELADFIQADLYNCSDPTIKIYGLETLDKASKGDVSFLVNRAYVKFLGDCKGSAIIIDPTLVERAFIPCLVTKNTRLALAKVTQLAVVAEEKTYGIHSSVIIGKNCNIHHDVKIGAYSVIGDNVNIGAGTIIDPGVHIYNNCTLEKNVKLFSQVVLYKNVFVGNNTTIHAGTIIGGDGFGYAEDDGVWVKMHHLGGVSIGNNVEIGSNVSIDRGFLGDTIIGEGVIIDNLVQIAHNVIIGKYTALAGCVGIAGSAKIGAHCLIGGGACIAGHIEIVDKVHITGMSGVNKSLLKPGVYSSGLPIKENRVWLKNVVRFQELDDLARRLIALDKQVKDLTPS